MKLTYNQIIGNRITQEMIEDHPHTLFIYDTTLKEMNENDIFSEYWNTFPVPTKIDVNTEFSGINESSGVTIIEEAFRSIRWIGGCNIFEYVSFSKYFANNLNKDSGVYKTIEVQLGLYFKINIKDTGLEFRPNPI